MTCASKDTSSTVVNNNSRNTVNQIVTYLESVGPLNLDKDRVKSIVDTQYTKKYLMGGQKGLANFVSDNVLKNADNKITYISSDRSRNTFKFLSEDGSVQTDTRGESVIDVLYDPVMNKIESEIYNPNEPYGGSYDSDDDEYINFQMIQDKYRQVKRLKTDPSDFYKQLSAKTSF